MLSITFYYREPRKTGVSIEGIFKLVKDCLKNEADIKEFYCEANLSRLQNTRKAEQFASDINHITGDVNFLAMGLKGRKNVLTVHDLGHYDTLKKRSFIQHATYKLFWFKLPLKNVQIVTVVSKFTKNKLMEYFHFPEDKIRIIPNPVKPIFQFVPKGKLNAKPIVLMMGTGKHKNLDNLIEAVKLFDYHLDIIGWPSRDELERLKNYDISHTIYNNLNDEQVYERYIACDILFNASFYEGFGMPIIEAQAVGRPVVTSNIGAMKEVAGNTAMLVNPDKPEEIAEAFSKLVTDKAYYKELVARGRQNAAKYDYREIAKQYMEVYKSLAG